MYYTHYCATLGIALAEDALRGQAYNTMPINLMFQNGTSQNETDEGKKKRPAALRSSRRLCALRL